MGVISSIPENCKYCLGCIRVCPTKALKSVDDKYFDVIDERCINCGICVYTCTQDALVVRNDVSRVLDLLSRKQCVAVLATEYVASFYPYQPEVVVAAFEKAGFFVVEDSTLAEEIVAREWLEFIQKSETPTVIRSTCPVVVEYIEKFHHQLIPYLAPIVSPMVAAGRLYKELYGHDTAVVYITPCIAAKSEAMDENVRDAVDAVLTFSEAKQLLRELEIDLDYVSPSAAESVKPVIVRKYSAHSGFPRKLLSQFTYADKDMKVASSFVDFEDILIGLEKNIIKPKIIDTLFCSTCIEGPAMATSLTVFARKKIVEEFYADRAKSSMRITLDQLLPRLPYFETKRIFRYRASDIKKPTEKDIEEILRLGERTSPEALLDCGACGYPTCYEHAVAIYYGYSDWSNCVPYQRAVFSRVLKQLREASSTDGLTGLYNHRAFLERLEQEFHRAQRYGSELSVLMIDLDGFKAVNDTYGHIAGDEVLKRAAQLLKENVRAADFVARYGGDEFSIILPETSKREAYAVAEKLRRAFEAEQFQVGGETVRLSISVGIAGLYTRHRSYYDLIEEADRAMYESKQSGKNRITTFSEESKIVDIDKINNIESITDEFGGENGV